jgi:hypothetical protein
MKCGLALAAVVSLGFGVLACGSAKDGGTRASSAVQRGTTASTATTGATGTRTGAQVSAKPTRSASPHAGGAASSGSSSSKGFPAPAPRHERYPRGDRSIQEYGSKAATGDAAAIAAVVKDYYAALAAADRSRACSLLAPRIAKTILSMLQRAPQLKGKGCEGVIAVILRTPTGRAKAAFDHVEVTGVRVKGDRAFALLRTGEMPHGEIPMVREAGTWKIGALVGSGLP